MYSMFVGLYLWVGTVLGAGIQHEQGGHHLFFSRESIVTDLKGYYISGPVERCGVWGITEPTRTGMKRGGHSWY